MITDEYWYTYYRVLLHNMSPCKDYVNSDKENEYVHKVAHSVMSHEMSDR